MASPLDAVVFVRNAYGKLTCLVSCPPQVTVKGMAGGKVHLGEYETPPLARAAVARAKEGLLAHGFDVKLNAAEDSASLLAPREVRTAPFSLPVHSPLALALAGRGKMGAR